MLRGLLQIGVAAPCRRSPAFLPSEVNYEGDADLRQISRHPCCRTPASMMKEWNDEDIAWS
jgi:hypothetical protein